MVRKAVTAIRAYLGRLLRAWTIWIGFLVLPAVAFAVDTFVPTFWLPAWLYAVILAIGFLVANGKLVVDYESKIREIEPSPEPESAHVPEETPKTAESELDDLKVRILHHAYDSLAAWVRERRTHQHQMFSWTNSVLLAVIGALVAFRPAGGGGLGLADKIVLTAAVSLLTLISYVWQAHSRLGEIHRAWILSDILDLLHLREDGFFGKDAVFPPSPQVERRITGWARAGLTWYNVATLLMAALTIVVVWIR